MFPQTAKKAIRILYLSNSTSGKTAHRETTDSRIKSMNFEYKTICTAHKANPNHIFTYANFTRVHWSWNKPRLKQILSTNITFPLSKSTLHILQLDISILQISLLIYTLEQQVLVSTEKHKN
ncbi:hypothetical protein CDL12_09045 [Handroanthus impetiginosus]|uniref:Uncharacterized protein n=1 Tax=Handroanthus impetiginosus TaxID=429701 RepID=A0A2G9HL72_9LAMI|nr:hypothetical protein CDL12_09045 [Handroanthus impetiginosus]